MLSPRQCRAARALLGLSQADLAERAGVSLSTVRDLETGWREKAGRSTVSADATAKIRRALDAAGVALLDENGGGEGVRLRRPSKRRS